MRNLSEGGRLGVERAPKAKVSFAVGAFSTAANYFHDSRYLYLPEKSWRNPGRHAKSAPQSCPRSPNLLHSLMIRPIAAGLRLRAPPGASLPRRLPRQVCRNSPIAPPVARTLRT